MGFNADPNLAARVSDLLRKRREAVVLRWTALVEEALPGRLVKMDGSVWAERVRDTLNGLQTELARPERLAHPIISEAAGSPNVLELGRRAVEAHYEGEGLEPYEFASSYFLLQQALNEALQQGLEPPQLAPAMQMVDHFIKQLAIAISMAITGARTRMLEEAVADRTAHLREMLRKEDEFLSFVSHEVRTALTAILGACDFLEDINASEPLTANQRRFVAMISRSGELIHVLVNDILDYAKLDTGQIKLRPEPLNLREVATDAVALLEARWRAKGLQVAVDVPPDLPDVTGDRLRVQQIFLNLLSNAIRFSPEGGQVVMHGRRVHDRVRMDVVDDGPGIPATERQRIFNRFEQLENALHRGDGTGLGLPIVKLLVDLHGGDVEVVPTSHGSRFRVCLPVRDGGNPPSA